MTRIAIDPSRPVGRLDRKVFGGFVEHLGRCIYGGRYEEGSPLSDGRGFRKDVLGLLRELRLGVLRWPGGNFVSNFSVDATPVGGGGGSAREDLLGAGAPNGVARLDPRAAVRAGTPVTFATDATRLHFFDSDTGHAIG